MTNSRDFFPLGKALGSAFCNRAEELKWLLENVKAGKHMLLIAPRRYGKSSLALRGILLSGLPAIVLNFNTCASSEDVERVIIHAVGELIKQIMGPLEQAIHVIRRYLFTLQPRLTWQLQDLHLEFIAPADTPSHEKIEEVLLMLEKLLEDKKTEAVLVLDEFQTVGGIAKGHGMEAALRNVAESVQHMTLIFSGSHRRLLLRMFEDEQRPLYKLCRKLRVDRIAIQHYELHLNRAAEQQWGSLLSEEVLNLVMTLSEQHPYYVNYLCDILWSISPDLPSLDGVRRAWVLLLDEEQSDAHAEIGALSIGQRKVLKYIASHGGVDITSVQAVKIMGSAASSIAGAVNVLVAKDLIEKDKLGTYQIINPVIRACLIV